MSNEPQYGTVGWLDLTVDDATGTRDFYADVVGWKAEPAPVGDYEDFVMSDEAGNPTAGICHARGNNTGLPPQWLSYVRVRSLEASMAAAKRHGGDVIHGPRDMGSYGTLCVVRDPEGAHLALMEPPREG